MPNWTKEQSDAINKDGTNIIVSAGAGSGKTAVLSERVLRKLKEGINVNELLILTFTKAAAKEMKERIRKKIKKEPSLSAQLELIDSAYITTFDSYSLSVLKKYHYLLNLPKNICITDSTLVQIKKEEILDNIFEELYEEKNEKFEEFIGTFCTKDDKEIRNYLLNIYSKLELKTDKKEKTSIKHILSQRNFWGIGIARFLADPAWGTINFWVPIFFVETLHFSLKEIAMFVWLPFLLGDLGCLASGFVAKFFHDRGVSLINSRRITFTIAAVIMMTIGLVSIVENPYIAVLLISIGAFSHQCLSTVAATLGGDLFKKDEVATAVGMAGACAWSGQLIFNLFIGAFVHIIGFAPFFIALAFFDIIGAIALWTLIKVKDEEPQVQLATS